jgi:hypothetical protein
MALLEVFQRRKTPVQKEMTVDKQQERPPAAVTPPLGSYPPDIRCQTQTPAA